MRIMNLPNLHTQLSSADECVRTYSERLEADNAPWPHVSVLLTAYLAWPNNEDRRNSFVASFLAQLGMASEKRANKPAVESRADITFENFGGMKAIASAALDQLSAEMNPCENAFIPSGPIGTMSIQMCRRSEVRQC